MASQFRNSSATQNNESRLWEGLIDGNREALNNLFRIYFENLLNYGIKLAGDQELVKDAIQKLFYKLWKSRQSLSKPASIKSYLFVSLRRILLAKIKREKAREKRNKLYMDAAFSYSFSIENEIITKETRNQDTQVLLKAIQKLSPRQKEALYLRFYDGLTNKEVAEVMEISHQSVRNHISEAIQSIKLHLSPSFSFSDLKPLNKLKQAESL